MKVLIVEPGKKVYVKDIANTLPVLQKIVCGHIEGFSFYEDVFIYCNDEGKFNGSLPNRAIYDKAGNLVDVIFGTFIITDYNDGDDLTEELIRKYTLLFDERIDVGYDILKYKIMRG